MTKQVVLTSKKTHSPYDWQNDIVDVHGSEPQVGPAPCDSALNEGRYHANEYAHRDDEVGTRRRVQVLCERPCYSVRVCTLNLLARPYIRARRVEEYVALRSDYGHHNNVVDNAT